MALTPVSEATVCLAVSVLIQFTVSPADTIAFEGLNEWLPVMSTFTVSPAGVPVESRLLELPPHPINTREVVTATTKPEMVAATFMFEDFSRSPVAGSWAEF